MSDSRDTVLVTFTLQLAPPSLEGERARLLQELLGGLPGMRQVVVGEGSHPRVTLVYDLQQLTLDRIETLLGERGFALEESFWHSQRRAWQRFTEANQLDHLNQSGHCCNKPPPGH